MRQAFHIFRKDVGRLSMELSISLVALAMLTWSEWLLSTPARNPRWYSEVLPVVVLFLAWWILVARLVHGESLVGDRQFWITRPYIWYKLLSSKLLFVFGWIAVPLAISQAVLVAATGAPLAHHFVPILRDSGVTVLVVILPIAALAAITRTFWQWVLCTMALVLAVIGLAAWLSSAPNSQVPIASDIADALQAIAFGTLVTAAISVQYASRRTLRAALFAAAAVVSLPVIVFSFPYRRLIEAAFPIIDTRTAPVHVALTGEMGLASAPSPNGSLELTIPVQLSAPDGGALAMLDAAMLSIGTTHGSAWNSEWRPIYSTLAEQAPRSVRMSFDLDRAVCERVMAGPAQLRLALAFRKLKDMHRQPVSVYRHFDVADVGQCWIEHSGDTITCRSTGSGPSLLLVSLPDGTAVGSSGPEHGENRRCSENHLIGLTSTLGPLSPLTLQTFSFANRSPAATCLGKADAGDKLSFSTPETLRRFRLELDLGVVRFSRQRVVAGNLSSTVVPRGGPSLE